LLRGVADMSMLQLLDRVDAAMLLPTLLLSMTGG